MRGAEPTWEGGGGGRRGSTQGPGTLHLGSVSFSGVWLAWCPGAVSCPPRGRDWGADFWLVGWPSAVQHVCLCLLLGDGGLFLAPPWQTQQLRGPWLSWDVLGGVLHGAWLAPGCGHDDGFVSQ